MKILLIAPLLIGLAQGQTKLTDGVIRYDRTGNTTSFWQYLTDKFGWIVGKPPFGKSVAFLIGVGEYKYVQPRLRYISSDLDDMRSFLLDQAGFDTVYIAKDDVVTTRLVEGYIFNGFPTPVEATDRLLFYFTGHGTDFGGHGYMQFAQAKPGVYDTEQNLDVTRLREWSEVLRAKHVLFLIDACNSGFGFDAKPGEASKKDDYLLNLFAGDGSRAVITAGTAKERSFEVSATENRQGYSVFTRAFLDAIRESDSQHGFLILDEVMGAVRRQIGEFSESHQGIHMTPRLWQIPRNSLDKGTFVFLNPKAKEPPVPKPLKGYLSITSKANHIDTKADAATTNSLGSLRQVNPRDGLNYVWIPGGSFNMGCSPEDAECRHDERPAHRVVITNGFFLGQTEVTRDAYDRVKANHRSSVSGMFPQTVFWDSAQDYCRAVGWRLPTEAEWEYAARGHEVVSRYGDLGDIAWFRDNTPMKYGSREPVLPAEKLPNSFGLYDMLGNAPEWVADWYADGYTDTATINPLGPDSGKNRVLRGGSVSSDPTDLRFSARAVPQHSYDEAGFRCVLETINSEIDTSTWASIENSRVPEDFERFAHVFPESIFAPSAKLRAAQLRHKAPTKAPNATSTPSPGEIQTNKKDGLEYVWIPPGPFQYEDCNDKQCSAFRFSTEEISKGFWFGKTEVSQTAYRRVTGRNPSKEQAPKLAVTNTTWKEARDYCKTVGLQLPTGPMWEHVRRLKYSELSGAILLPKHMGLTEAIFLSGAGVPGSDKPEESYPFGILDLSKMEWTSEQTEQFHIGSRSHTVPAEPGKPAVYGRGGVLTPAKPPTKEHQTCDDCYSYKAARVANSGAWSLESSSELIHFRCAGGPR